MNLQTIQRSGAHDLRCPAEQVVARRLEGKEYAADGCGQRATYKFVQEPGYVFRVLLIARVSL